ncbi:hypothetical protein [Bizionia arctica]|uniref:Uncharacterized protein n=1 Tax=Bizionia arctica TaxID=1495645 RepID=A0A917GCK3_9FLAO|nr:hypothetical protein [Bizionia arctica]GGG37908.1 hypothetical protein GCM10010976_07030 [Bizionia arctica]
MALISAPSIISAMDDSIDISQFFSITEEEETAKILLEINLTETEHLILTSSNENLGYYKKNYTKPHLNLISPPPEFIS